MINERILTMRKEEFDDDDDGDDDDDDDDGNDDRTKDRGSKMRKDVCH